MDASREFRYPFLREAGEVPGFLSDFFTGGRVAAGARLMLAKGLWDVLQWCWRQGEQGSTPDLCSLLLARPDGTGLWREDDICEAMSRCRGPQDPSRIRPAEVHRLVRGFIQEGERLRRDRVEASLEIEFLLPRLDSHPLFPRHLIREALLSSGTPAGEIDDHMSAVHPPRHPYQGRWTLAVRERLRAVAPQRPEGSPGTRIRIEDPRVGARSEVVLHLVSPPELAGYWNLTLQSFVAGSGAGVGGRPVSPPRT